MPSSNLIKNSEIGQKISPEKPSEFETINLTEWLIFKIKIIYGRPIFEGDSPEEATAIRQEWQDLVLKIGKKGVLGTIDYLLSGHHAVPSFPPSPVEFRKCYRTHISASARKDEFEKSLPLTIEQKQVAQESIKKILEALKRGCFERNNISKNSGEVRSRMQGN